MTVTTFHHMTELAIDPNPVARHGRRVPEPPAAYVVPDRDDQPQCEKRLVKPPSHMFVIIPGARVDDA